VSETGPAGGGTATQATTAPADEAALEAFEIHPSRLGESKIRPGADLVLGGELRHRRAGVPWSAARVALHVTLLFVPWFVLQQLARFFVGFRRQATLRLAPDGLVLRRRASILGRRMRDSELHYPLTTVLGIGRVKRYRWLHLLLGLLCLAVGGSVGIIAIHDGIAGGYAPLALAGFGLLGLGVVIDLALNVLVPAARRQVQLEVRLPREDLWIAGVDEDLAGEFVRAVMQAVARKER
jgi:hypothetical protein